MQVIHSPSLDTSFAFSTYHTVFLITCHMSSTKLAVIVVGGGIGGLACALALRQAGHQVTVLESTAWLSETGAAVTVQPNSGSALSKLGLDMQDLRGTKAETAITHLLTDLDGASEDIEQPWVGISKQYDCPVHFVHREDLHNALKARCSDPTGQGTPVELKLSSCVTAYDINAGDVTVSDGNKYSADVVVAADGVRSIAHNEVLGYEYPAFPSNLSNVRFILPTQVLEDDPELAPLLADGPSFVFWAAPGRKRILMRYPCREYVHSPHSIAWLSDQNSAATNCKPLAPTWWTMQDPATEARK